MQRTRCNHWVLAHLAAALVAATLALGAAPAAAESEPPWGSVPVVTVAPAAPAVPDVAAEPDPAAPAVAAVPDVAAGPDSAAPVVAAVPDVAAGPDSAALAQPVEEPEVATAAPAPRAACTVPLSGVGGPDAALDWLTCQLETNGGSMPGFTPGTPEYGLTIDAILALTAGGRGDGSAATTAFAIVASGIRSYVTDQDFGAGDERYAGALGKALLVSEVRGVNVDDVGGMDLDDEVRARMQTTGPEAGRFSDLSTFGDYSNGFGQTLAMMGLSYTADGVPAPAVSFLLQQQCPGGGFRGAYTGTSGCTDDAEADTDYTGLAVQALLASPASGPVDTAVDAAVAWLLARQQPSGGFGGAGVTSGVNTNSAGFAAQALRAVGEVAAADAAASWVAGLQLTTASAGSGPGLADLGAIAYDPGAMADGVATGIADPGRDQWRRATAQATLVFGAQAFGAPRPPVVVVPTVPAEPTTPVTVASPTTAAATSLPRTGGNVWPLTLVGSLALLVGLALTTASRRLAASTG